MSLTMSHELSRFERGEEVSCALIGHPALDHIKVFPAHLSSEVRSSPMSLIKAQSLVYS